MFTGEQMQCFQCQFQQQSHPEIESGWFAVVVDGNRHQLCPKCAGTATPKCSNCNRFYHENYNNCPWCKATRHMRGAVTLGNQEDDRP